MPVRARLSLLALLAIAVPAAIVAVLGCVSLRHWQASAELLFREQARDMAAMAVDKIEMTLRETENGLIAELQGALEAPGPLARALDDFRAAHPLVRRLYLFDRRGELLYPATRDEGDAAIFARLLAEVSQGFWERGGRRELAGGDQIALAAILRSGDGRPVLATLDLGCRGPVRGHPGPDRAHPGGPDHPGRARRARSADLQQGVPGRGRSPPHRALSASAWAPGGWPSINLRATRRARPCAGR